MPGYAGSSWYFLRYMDPHNDATFCDKSISSYWNQVDLYVGGTEHAVGHLLYSRMWTKCLFDLGLITFDEPFKRLLNQGMITAFSYFGEKIEFEDIATGQTKMFVCSAGEYASTSGSELYNIGDKVYKKKRFIWPERLKGVSNYVEIGTSTYRITEEKLKVYLNEFGRDLAGFLIDDIVFNSTILKNTGEKIFSVRPEVEKMSKSKFNVENPDTIVEKYGADTFRMYEMFLGPVEMSKPWDTKGIEGVHRFLKKLWRLFINENGLRVTDEKATVSFGGMIS
jgi:leucyl-tRNA synthetase